MSSYLRNEGRRARRRLVIATTLVVALFLIDLVSGGSLRALVRSVGASTWSFGAAAGNALFGSGYFSSKRALSAEIESLRGMLAEREATDGRLEVLERENEELRVIAQLTELAGVAARIISSTSASPYGTFMINAGREDGVREGDAVLAGSERGIVLGRIAEVRARSALVKELFAPGEHVEAAIGSTELSLEGRGGGNARAEAPSALSIGVDEVVTIPRYGNRVIGIVGAVSEKEGSGLLQIFVRAPVRATNLRFVYVVRSLE